MLVKAQTLQPPCSMTAARATLLVQQFVMLK
jgi:hypothetical protein